MIKALTRFFIENKLLVWMLLLAILLGGYITAPFNLDTFALPRDPVAVDAIPDIGENQQIVFSQWPGRSPQDIEDQVTYPLTTALLGVPGVKSVRSNSMFGFSSIYIIFEETIDFYWSRSRLLEKLNALPAGILPEGVRPMLGPDATGLGQIFWYTLEGRTADGATTGGWDLQELRSIQDFYVRYALSSTEGVAEVASIGGFVKEYQIDVDPEAMKAKGISLDDVLNAVRNSNIDIGAKTMEINQAEYFVRGLGYIKEVADLENSVVKARRNIPIFIKDIGRVSLGPATRRGVLDKSGAEVVGGVVVARYGSNPMQVIQNIKSKVEELEKGLPSKTLADGTVSQVKIIPFYDRTQLIQETLGTLQEALSLEILITMIVIVLLLLHLDAALLVSGTLPLGVLLCFIAMRYLGVDANIVALSGIAIAIGTMVDIGIVLAESIVLQVEKTENKSLTDQIVEATQEVAPAIITAIATTIISFLPVMSMVAAEGKLFRPLVYTKTFALLAALLIALVLIPTLGHSLFKFRRRKMVAQLIINGILFSIGAVLWYVYAIKAGPALMLLAFLEALDAYLKQNTSTGFKKGFRIVKNIIYAALLAFFLSSVWMPLGVNKSVWLNWFFIIGLIFLLIGFIFLFIHFYEAILQLLLKIKLLFILAIIAFIFYGFSIYQSIGKEFMPALDEGAFLLMPTAMPHAGMQENIKNLRLLDMAVTAIPEVEMVVGKAGRVESALDPAPMSMYENIIQYKSEYKTDVNGHRLRFKVDVEGAYIRDKNEELIPDPNGRYFRQWRDEIKSPEDIWAEISRVTKLPGLTSAPKLQPIETRLIMLQTGMRAPIGIKVSGSDLQEIEAFGLELEQALKQVEGVKKAAVFAERIVGKPYLLIEVDRQAISRYGLEVATVQRYIQTAVGGLQLSTSVEGRERYAIRVRYPREWRDNPESLSNILIPIASGGQIPLSELVKIDYQQGPQSIKSEDGFLVSYVLFDKEEGYSEVEVVENAQAYLGKRLEEGTLLLPPGVSYRFAGNYEQQLRANRQLLFTSVIALLLIFVILYLQFQSVPVALMVFMGVFVAFAGGFMMLDWYQSAWFLNLDIFGINLRELFQVKPINFSVAVGVGFLALFGIATDDGVLVATFLKNQFKTAQPESIDAIRTAVVKGGLRRVRPAMMTTATTILALMPILTATGRGADIMIPMAIPVFGGMLFQILTLFTVPVLFSMWQEWKLRLAKNQKR